MENECCFHLSLDILQSKTTLQSKIQEQAYMNKYKNMSNDVKCEKMFSASTGQVTN